MFALEDRVYFDGAAVAAVSAAAATPAKDNAAATTAPPPADSSASSATHSGISNVDSLIASIANADASHSSDGKEIVAVSSAVANASQVETAAKAAGMTVVEYNSSESLSQVLASIQTALGDSKAVSINFVVADNNAAGFALVSGETTNAMTIASESAFWNGVSSLLANGGEVSVSGDASLTASGYSSLETSLANAAGHEVSFIDSSSGSITTAFADSQDVNVYFMDSSVKDSSTIISSLPDNALIVRLTDGGDGVAEITSYLSTHSNIDSVNIVTHGFTGYIYLGKDLVNSDSLASTYANDVASWGKSLAGSGVINIYSCLTASDSSGKAFVNEFATLTGATVEASTNATGIDGDWTLEYASSANASLSSLDVHNYSYDLDTVGTWANLKTAIENNHLTSITLSADLTLVNTDSTITVDYSAQAAKTVTISGGSHTIGNSSGGTAFTSTYFAVTGAGTSLTLSGLTVSGAQTTAITVAANTTLTCERCAFTSNNDAHNGNGGAIYNAGTLALTSCTFSSNSVNGALRGGGAIYNEGTLTATSCTFSSNSTSNACSGGAIYNHGISVTLNACVFNGNSASSYGGAIYTNAGTLTANSCTFYNNHAYGGGAISIAAGTVTLNACTIAGNYITGGSHASGGGVYIEGGSLTIENSIVASNTNVGNPDDISIEGGSCTSGGYNIIGTAPGFVLAATDQSFSSGASNLWASNANGSSSSASPIFDSGTGAIYIYSGSGALAFSKIISANNFNNHPGYDVAGTIAFSGNRDIGSFQCSRAGGSSSYTGGYNSDKTKQYPPADDNAEEEQKARNKIDSYLSGMLEYYGSALRYCGSLSGVIIFSDLRRNIGMELTQIDYFTHALGKALHMNLGLRSNGDVAVLPEGEHGVSQSDAINGIRSSSYFNIYFGSDSSAHLDSQFDKHPLFKTKVDLLLDAVCAV